MKSIMNSVLIALAVLAAALAMPRHSSTVHGGSNATLSLSELEAAAGANRLPLQQLDDRSLVFSTAGMP